jgi:hypothetical protein
VKAIDATIIKGLLESYYLLSAKLNSSLSISSFIKITLSSLNFLRSANYVISYTISLYKLIKIFTRISFGSLVRASEAP